jgi:Cu+-exporting ATPase
MTETSTNATDTAPASRQKLACFHCGTLCRDDAFRRDEKVFCCNGCKTVFELLTENGLTDFYQLSTTAGVRVNASAQSDRFKFLDEPLVRERLVDFTNAKLTRVTFLIPSIHCIACVWLLENLFRLKPGIGQSQVNFPLKEAAIAFETERVKLSELVTLLASLGYEPELKLSSLDAKPRSQLARRLWIQIGFAGFAFSNIMLFSISDYFGLDSFAGGNFRKVTGVISLLLALPVVTFSAQDYWRAAWTSLKQRLLNIDVPIAAGVAAIFTQSCYEVFTGRGIGYFDSLCGLIFFLLCGKLFQQKTHDRLVFDRDYKSFFPLSVTRLERRSPTRLVGAGVQAVACSSDTLKRELQRAGPKSGASVETQVSLSQISVGDRLIIRNGELIPADARLADGPALIDYSFVTGESEPVEKKLDDYLYAGGRQMGGAIVVEMAKAVSQSYLTSLWNQEAFQKEHKRALNRLTNTYSQRFTKIVILIAVGAAAYWAWADPAIALKAFTSVLIVACPCALALAAPFALGTAQRVLARSGVLLKNPYILETLAEVDAVVFDKTGTLTAAGAGNVIWHGDALVETEERWLYSMTRHSTHPLAVRIGEAIKREHFPETVRSLLETAGCGMEASVAGNEIWMGSASWLESRLVLITDAPANPGSTVHVAIGGFYRGCFLLANALRANAETVVVNLAQDCSVALLSGDNERERETFTKMFGAKAQLHFNQSPQRKLGFIRDLQGKGKTVMMVGDGLNDAGALKQADVGVAVVENVSAFSPASDAILSAVMMPRLDEVRAFARSSVRIVRAAFIISALYNFIGVAIAASGRLAPVVCAILMPLSSVSVVGFACLAAKWSGRKLSRTPDGDSLKKSSEVAKNR